MPKVLARDKCPVVYPSQWNPTSLAPEAKDLFTKEELDLAALEEIERLLDEQDEDTPTDMIEFWEHRVRKLSWRDLVERVKTVVINKGMLYNQTAYYKAVVKVMRALKPSPTKP